MDGKHMCTDREGNVKRTKRTDGQQTHSNLLGIFLCFLDISCIRKSIIYASRPPCPSRSPIQGSLIEAPPPEGSAASVARMAFHEGEGLHKKSARDLELKLIVSLPLVSFLWVGILLGPLDGLREGGLLLQESKLLSLPYAMV